MNENDPIREYQARLQKLHERAERLRPVLKSCQEAIQRSGVNASICVGRQTSVAPKVEIMMFCKRLEKTVPLFRELAKEGLKTNKTNTHKDINLLKVMPMRVYDLGQDCELIAMIMSSKEDEFGTSCRMEQVGTEEIPIYEMKCD